MQIFTAIYHEKDDIYLHASFEEKPASKRFIGFIRAIIDRWMAFKRAFAFLTTLLYASSAISFYDFEIGC